MNYDSTVNGASYWMARVHNNSCAHYGTAPDYYGPAALSVKFLWNDEGCKSSQGECYGNQVFQEVISIFGLECCSGT